MPRCEAPASACVSVVSRISPIEISICPRRGRSDLRSVVEARSQRPSPRPPRAISSPDKFIPARKRASGQLKAQRVDLEERRKKRRDRLEISSYPLDSSGPLESALARVRASATDERTNERTNERTANYSLTLSRAFREPSCSPR